MKRIQVNLLDDLEEKVRLFKQAESIKTMAQACLRLIVLGIDNYCDSYKKEIKNDIKKLGQKSDNIEAILNKLIEALKIMTRNNNY